MGYAWLEGELGVEVVGEPTLIQELWGGYGRIERVRVRSGPSGDQAFPDATVVLKAIHRPRAGVQHPRGWDSDLGARRKMKSYTVERAFYRQHAGRLDASARVPRFHGGEESPDGGRMILEDLDASGFSGRREEIGPSELDACLRWLASLHAAFYGCDPEGLWERGTYWHLETRPEELAATADARVRAAAHGIDRRLSGARHRTFVHGDAKVANFCFAPERDPARVAAVDFQYVGGGVGVQDVSYFLGSIFADGQLDAHADASLEQYFGHLESALESRSVPRGEVRDLVDEWRGLWPWAWADFHRFLCGWAPGHWKLSSYSEAMMTKVLGELR